MADPVSMLGTVVGVASLAIQLTQILHEYYTGVSDHKNDVEFLLTDVKQLQHALTELEGLVRIDSLRLSQPFTTTSTLYLTNARCKVRLTSLLAELQNNLQVSQARSALRALRWPFKAQELHKISAEIRGYIQTFHFALTVDGSRLLLKTSGEVTQTLQNSLRSATVAEQSTNDIRLILSTITASTDTTQAIQRGVQVLVDEQLLDWLGPAHASAKHQAVARKRSPDTGQWIFQDECYKQWCDGPLPILWAQGKPGAGKSTLMACIVDKLNADCGEDEGVAAFFCEYSQASDAQTPERILASLSRQLLMRLGSTPHGVHDIYQRHYRESTPLGLLEHKEILRLICGSFSKVWLLFDALDELGQEHRSRLMGVFESIMTFTHILITSRPQSIDNEILEENTLRCTISAQREDLTVFIKTRLATASRGLRKNPGWEAFANDAVEKLVTLADGMFILVSLQLDKLLQQHTVIEMRKVLETISDKVDDFYQRTLDRIKAGGSDTPLKILAWLVAAPWPPISVLELREALAVEASTTFIDPDAMVPEDDIIPMCCGLVVANGNYDLKFKIISLAHSTVHEYLSNNLAMAHGFDRVIAQTCVRYAKLPEFSKPGLGYDDEDSKDTVEFLERHPFGRYAALYHSYKIIRDTIDPDIVQRALARVRLQKTVSSRNGSAE